MADTLAGTLDTPSARVSVALNWDSVPVPTTATIQRVDASGGITGVRGAEQVTLVAGAWVGNDYEAPLDEQFYYVATSTDRPGVTLTSANYTMPSNGLSWLKHPGRPFLNTTVEVAQAPDWTRPATQGVFDVLGRSAPVAVTLRRSSPRGDLLLNTTRDADRSALLSLLDDGSPLYLQTPSAYGLGNIYVSVGEVTETRPTHVGSEWARRWSLPVVVIDRPVGGVLAAGNSWSDVLGHYASWTALQQVEGTWTGVLEGIA